MFQAGETGRDEYLRKLPGQNVGRWTEGTACTVALGRACRSQRRCEVYFWVGCREGRGEASMGGVVEENPGVCSPEGRGCDTESALAGRAGQRGGGPASTRGSAQRSRALGALP